MIKNHKYSKSGLKPAAADSALKKLDKLMKKEKPFLDPGLSLSDLAGRMNLSRNTLSQILNGYLKTNFYDFINSFRLDEAKSLMEKEAGRCDIRKTASASGFKSRSAFYSAFKKMTGQTPGGFQKKFIFRRTQGNKRRH